MPLSEHERQVLLFNLHVAVIPDEAADSVSLNVTDTIKLLKEIFDAGNAYMKVGEYVAEPEDVLPKSAAEEASGARMMSLKAKTSFE